MSGDLKLLHAYPGSKPRTRRSFDPDRVLMHHSFLVHQSFRLGIV